MPQISRTKGVAWKGTWVPHHAGKGATFPLLLPHPCLYPFTALWLRHLTLRNSRSLETDARLAYTKNGVQYYIAEMAYRGLEQCSQKYPKTEPGMRVRAALDLSRNAWRLSLKQPCRPPIHR